MQRIVKEIPLDCELVFLGDTHGGSKLTHYSGIREIIDYIELKKDVYWMHGGDWIEAVTTDDKRFNPEICEEPIPFKQADEMIELFSRIGKCGVVGLGGNHELKLHRFGNLAEYICKMLCIPYGTRSARVAFTHKGKRLFNVFITHDIPILRSNAKDVIQAEANIKAALKQSLYKRLGDCAVMIAHHAHQLITIDPHPGLYLVDTPKGVKQHYLQPDMGGKDKYINPDQRFYGCAGSFRKRYVDGVDDYSDIYAPNELGCLIAKVEGGKVKSLRKFIV